MINRVFSENMKTILPFMNGCVSLLALTILTLPVRLKGQSADSSATPPTNAPAPSNWSASQDHKNMMQQLGIVRLRPGPGGQPGATNSANYDEAKANPFPDLP